MRSEAEEGDARGVTEATWESLDFARSGTRHFLSCENSRGKLFLLLYLGPWWWRVEVEGQLYSNMGVSLL